MFNINPWDYLDKPESTELVIDIKVLGRLSSYLASDEGEISLSFTVREGTFGEGLFLHMRLKGSLMIRCNRCLEGYHYPLETETVLLIEDPKKVQSEMTESLESVSLDERGELDLLSIVTDEMVLGLPFAHKEACQNTEYQKYVYNAAIAP